VLLGKGNGTFQPAVNYSISNDPQVANFPGFVTVGRLRNNGPLDIVTTNFGSANVTVLLGNGDGTFGAPIHLNAGAGNEAAAIADFNDDGSPDILVTNNSTDTVILLPGNSDGTFRAPVQLATGARPFAMAVGQFDSHNLPEVAVLGASTISVLLNDSGGAGLVSTVAPSMLMQPANGMAQLGEALLMEAWMDAYFQMLDARLLSLESSIAARLPQLGGMIQTFNAMVTRVESAIAGHPADDLSGKV
jgi:hypothetical protein